MILLKPEMQVRRGQSVECFPSFLVSSTYVHYLAAMLCGRVRAFTCACNRLIYRCSLGISEQARTPRHTCQRLRGILRPSSNSVNMM